jgi:LmbE family N-acetylglucosaminyl deacetylase
MNRRHARVISLHLPGPPGRALEVLVVGAQADDIEIGCGGTIFTWPPVTCSCTSPGSS